MDVYRCLRRIRRARRRNLDRGAAEPETVKSQVASSRDLVAEGYSEHARSQRRLFHDEIVGAGEGGCMRIGQILAVQRRVPEILGDSDRSRKARIRGILESQTRGADVARAREGWVGSRLRE